MKVQIVNRTVEVTTPITVSDFCKAAVVRTDLFIGALFAATGRMLRVQDVLTEEEIKSAASEIVTDVSVRHSTGK